MIEEYVATGRVRFEYRDFAFLGEESTRAAEAAACAADQGAYWAYHDTLYANQHGQNEGAFADARLTAMARELGLDVERFEECLDEGRHEAEIAAMTEEARASGIGSTPTLVVDGRPTPYRGYDALRQEIEAALGG